MRGDGMRYKGESVMDQSISKWLSMDREQLDRIYQEASAGAIPTGDARGTAIVAGATLAQLYARFARLFAWQGKVFDMFSPDQQQGILINKVSAWSLTFIVAKCTGVRVGWMARKPSSSIILKHLFLPRKSAMKSVRSSRAFT